MNNYLWKGGSSIHRFNVEPIQCQQDYEELQKLSDKPKKDVLDMDSRLLRISSGEIRESLTFLFKRNGYKLMLPSGGPGYKLMLPSGGPSGKYTKY